MARHRTAPPPPPPPLVVLFVLLHLFAAARPCLAQQGNDSSSSHSHSKTAGGFTPTTVIVLVVLISAFVVLTLFSIYINRCAPGRPPPRRPFRYAADHLHHHQQATGAHGVVQAQPPDHRGLDRDVVESFPTAVYGDVKARVAAGSGPLECAVCLAAFDDLDELRVLPACCHVFHPDCIDPWLAAAVTCPLCRADLTAPAPLADPPASADDACCDVREAVSDEPGDDDEEEEERLVAASAAAFTPESVMSFGAASRPHQYRRTQSAMDAPDRHTLRLPEHVMRELAAVRRHRRAASLAGYPDAAVERTTPGSGGWLASLWRSVSWQRPHGHATDAAAEEHGHGGSKRVVPVPETPAGGRPGGSGSSPGAATDGKPKPDFDALNNQV